MQLNINTDAVVKHTNTLEKLHKKHLPNAIRGALNKAAFDVKTDTLSRSAKKNFIERSPNFFKAFSRVERATGFNVKTMKSTVGMVNEGLKGEHNFAVKDLEQQEKGGTIDGKSFIPLPEARSGKVKPVRPGNRLSSLPMAKMLNAAKGKGKNKQEKFITTAIAAGVGGLVLSNTSKPMLLRITSIKRRKLKLIGRSNTAVIKYKALYTFKKGRKVSVSKTNFAKEAAISSAKKIEAFFIKEAEFQIDLAKKQSKKH